MSYTYHYGVPGYVIWAVHILIGLFLLYVGYMAVVQKPAGMWTGITLIVLGVLVILYHLHIWIMSYYNNVPPPTAAKKSY